jgi:putative chitinase
MSYLWINKRKRLTMLLKVGSKGEDVKKLQQKLGLTADGIFGQGTAKVVMKWQIDNDLTPDGIVGEGTWNKMFGTKVLITEPSSPIVSVSGLNLKSLKGHIPDSVITQIPDTSSKFKINTPLRLAHFLAQCGHESGGFKITQENLNYSAKGLKNIFAKYFKEAGLAEAYERKPEKIANRVYGGRMGNGTEPTGDGFKYRGRGFIQLTGKDNYTAFGKAINEDILSNPDLVSTKYPLLSAAWFFQRCLSKCDLGSSRDAITSVSKCVNGGTIGLEDRIKHFNEFYNLLK